jgi:UDP-4-amino-4,6-dideoxy-N-acetyl-beta-L-altrosamine N-acetyltransferase
MLHGKKVALTDVTPTDLPMMRLWRNRPELRKYFREYRILSEPMQQEWFEHSQKDHKQVNFCIRAEGNVLIGHCGLYYIDWISRHAEFGLYIGEMWYRNGGYGSDALRTLIKYGFEDLNLHRITCEVYDNNEAIKIYEHVGFKREGTMREHYYNEGRYWDAHMLGMIKEDYERINLAK